MLDAVRLRLHDGHMTTPALLLAATSLLLMAAIPSAAQPVPSPATLPSGTSTAPIIHTPDPSARHQTLDHFGASDCWTMKLLDHWSPASRERLADLLFTDKGLALSQWRFNAGAGPDAPRIGDPLRTTASFETAPGVYDFTRLPTERWMLAAAKARGVNNFLLFANSPPRRLTLNNHTNPDPGPHSTNLRPGAEADFARYLADIVEHFARRAPEAERVIFSHVSPINEPQWEWNKANQEGTRAANDDIKAVVVPLARELAARDLPSSVHVVESGAIDELYQPNEKMTRQHGKLFGNYIDSFLGDPAIRPLIHNSLGYHSYWSDTPEHLVPRRVKARAALDRHPGATLWQTEYCVMEHRRDMGIGTALRVARVIHADLTIVNVAGWSWWLALSNGDYKDGLVFTDYRKPGDLESILLPKLFHAYAHFSRFVRPGMTRIALTGHTDDYTALLASAWLDPATGRTVVVYINNADTPRTVSLRSTHPSRQAYLTTAENADDVRPLPPTAADAPLTLPPKALMTVVLN